MKLLLISLPLILASCASYQDQARSYVYTTKVKVLGVKCAQDYFFNYELGKCTALTSRPGSLPSSAASPKAVSSNAEGITSYTPTGVSQDVVHIYKAAPDRSIKLYKPHRRIIKPKPKDLVGQCRILLNKGEL